MAETDLTTSGETVYSEADSGWKEAIEIYLCATRRDMCMAFKHLLPIVGRQVYPPSL